MKKRKRNARTNEVFSLQNQRNFIRRLGDTFPHMLSLYDLEERGFVFVNRRITEVLGYPSEQLLQRGVAFLQEILHPEDREEFLTHVSRCHQAQEGETFTCIYRLRRADGDWRWIHSQDSFFQENTSRFLINVAQDITEQKIGEAALLEGAQLMAVHKDIVAALIRDYDVLSEMLHDCAEILVKHLDAAFVRIWTLNAVGDTLELQASAGLYTHIDGAHARISVGQFKIGRIAQERQPHLTNSVIGDPLIQDQAWAKQEGLVAFAGYPLLVEDQLVGVIGLFAKKALTETTLLALGTAAGEIALGIVRRQAALSFRRSEGRFRAIFEGTAIGIGFVDTEGNFIETNPALQRMLEYSAEELQRVGFAAITYPEDLESDVNSFVDLVSGGCDFYQLEKRYVRKNGEIFWGWLTVFLIKSDDAQRFAVGLVEDITERRRLKDELAESEARLRGIIDSAMDAIITLDAEQRIVMFNMAAERMFRCKAADALGAAIDRFLPVRFRSLHREYIRTFARTGISNRRMGQLGTVWGLRADGEEFPIEAAISQLEMKEQKLFTVILRDVTEQNRFEQKKLAE